MSLSLDNVNAHQVYDFENMNEDTEEVEKFFDVDHEPQPSRRETFEKPMPTTPQVLKEYCASIKQEDDNKENTTPVSARKRRTSSSIGNTSTYLTPQSTTKRKSQITVAENGRAVLIQNYDGIQIITPNKTHQMETRLDAYIKSPGLQLRSRTVLKELNTEELEEHMKYMQPKKGKTVAFAEPSITAVKLIAEETTTEEHVEPVVMAKPQEEAVVLHKPIRPIIRAPVAAQRKQVIKERPAMPLIKNQSKGYVSSAEAIHHFLKDTPERFHSKPANAKLPNKLHVSKQQGPKPNTIPKSPFLATKTRVNFKYTEHIPNQEEREKLELEDMKKHQVKAHPVNREVLIPPPKKFIYHSKTPTKPEPFKLSYGKRKEPTPEPVFKFKAKPAPQRILSSPIGVPARKPLPLTYPESPNLAISAKYPKRMKVETPGKDVDVLYFGLNQKRATPNRPTRVQPFSFEQREKELLRRRKELMEKGQEDLNDHQFKATKMPSFKSPRMPEKKLLPLTTPQTPNLSGLRKTPTKKQIEAEPVVPVFKAKPATVTHQKPFVPVIQKRLLPSKMLELETEKRAAERAQFEAQLKQKEEEYAALMARVNAQAEAEEKAKIASLRKEAEFKANPVRQFIPVVIHPSEMPLTDPVSPNFRCKQRANSSHNKTTDSK